MISTQGRRLQMKLLCPTAVSARDAQRVGRDSGIALSFTAISLRLLAFPALVAVLFYAAQTPAAFAQAGGAKTQTGGAAQTAGNSQAGAGSGNSKSGNSGCSSNTGTVAYPDLKSKKASLPYGQPFAITGATTDVQLSTGTLTDFMNAKTVSGDYATSDGNKGTIPPSSITGTNWQVSVGKLNADTSVTINFQFTGTLVAGVQQTVIGKVYADPAFTAAISQFVTAAQGKDSTAALGGMTLLSQAIVDVVTSELNQSGLTPKSPSDLKSSLGPVILSYIEPFSNLALQLPELQNPAYHVGDLVGMPLQDFSALSVQQLYDKLKGVSDSDYSKLPTAVQGTDKTTVQRFLQTYHNVLAALNSGLQSVLFQGSSSLVVGSDQQSDVVCDLKKYAGFDVGALYAYRLSELRSFAMVHIYLGPVQLKTDAPPLKPGGWESVRQRVSLAFGMAIKDLSGASNSKISSENAFVYGVGVRLNKYFRLSAGGMLYRTTLPAKNGVTSPANGTLRQEIFVGPSIDVTALPALKSIFAKSQSN